MTLAPEVERTPDFEDKTADPVPSNPAIDKRANRLLDEAGVWGDQMAAMWTRLLTREHKVIAAKLRGSKAREGTRFWDPPPPEHETKEFKVGRFVDKERWLGELEDELRPILDRLYESFIKRGAALFEEKGKRQRRRDRVAAAADKARLAKLTADRISEARDYHAAWLDRLTEMADRIAAQPNSTVDGLIDQIEVRYSHAAEEVTAVAHSQAIGATNEAQLEVVRDLGVKGKKVWWTATDNRVRDAHRLVHGQRRDLDKPFTLGKISMDYPGDRSAPPKLWINCRCVLLFYPMTTAGEPDVALEAASRWLDMQDDLARDILDWSHRLETKGKKPRKVKTPGGQRFYDQPIGSIIVPDQLLHHASGTVTRLGSQENPWRTSSAKAAILHLESGDYVQLDRPKHVATLLKQLRKIAKEAEQRGDAAPLFDLCKVTVRDTSLFCVKSHGIPRVQMPQLTGIPIPGSRADNLLRDAKGRVDLAPYFLEHLAKHGAIVHHDLEIASRLIASQNELDGAKVGRMMRRIKKGEQVRELFVSDDNYIVDGHHHWAATVGLDTSNDIEGELHMRIARVDMGIFELLALANEFANEWGIAPRAVEEKEGDPLDVKTILRRVRTQAGRHRFHLPIGSPIVGGGQPDVSPQALAHAQAETSHLTEEQHLRSGLRDWVMWDPSKQIRMSAGELTGTYDDVLSPQLYEDPDDSAAVEAARIYGGRPYGVSPQQEERNAAFSYVEYEAEARAMLNALSAAPPHDGELWRHVNLPRDMQQPFDAAINEGHVDLPLEAVGDSSWFIDRFDRTRTPEDPQEPKHPKFDTPEAEQEYFYWLNDPEAPAGWQEDQARDNQRAEFHVPVLFRILPGARTLQGDKQLYLDQNRGAWQEYVTGGRFEVVSDETVVIPSRYTPDHPMYTEPRNQTRVITLRQTHTLLPGGSTVPTPIPAAGPVDITQPADAAAPELVGAKGLLHRVRTHAGEERFDLPIDSPIVPHPHLTAPRVRIASPLPPIRDFSSWGDRSHDIEALAPRLRPEALIPHHDRFVMANGIRVDRQKLTNDDAINTLRGLYEFDDPNTGLHTRITRAEQVGHGRWRVMGAVFSADQEQAGAFEKTVDVGADPPMAFHGLITLHDRYQGQGFGERLLRHEENAYIAMGIQHVDLLAGLTGGGYAWARAGFDWHASPGAMKAPWFNVRRRMEGRLMTASPEEKHTLLDLLARFDEADHTGDVTDAPTPAEIAQTPSGKQILRGSEWEARKTLVPPLVLAGKAMTDAALARARVLATAAEDWWEECQAVGFDLGDEGLDWVPADHPETKAVAVRHVRTPEGHALYGEEIGDIIRPNLPDLPGSSGLLTNWDRLQDRAVDHYTDTPSPRYWLRSDGKWIPVQWHEEAFPPEMKPSAGNYGGYRAIGDATNAVRVTVGANEASINIFNPMTPAQIDALSAIRRPYIIVAPESPATGGQVRRLEGPLYPGMEDRGPTGVVEHEVLRDALTWANRLLSGRVLHPSRLAEFKAVVQSSWRSGFLDDIERLTLEAKSRAVPHVRTEAGRQKYGQPIGTPIVTHPHTPTGQMMRRLAKGGGFTIHPNGAEPTTGYAVALDHHSSITPAADFFSSEDHANDIVKDWLRKNAAVFNDQTWHIGGWYDRVHDEIVLDPSQVVPDLATASILAVTRDQQAIRDLANQVDIPTGGTGGREGKSWGAVDPGQAAEADLGDERGRAGRLLPFDRVKDVRAGREEAADSADGADPADGVLGALARVVALREVKASRFASHSQSDADNLYHLGHSHHTTGGRWYRPPASPEEKRGPGHVRTPEGVRKYGLPLNSLIVSRHTPGALPHFAHSIVPTAAPMAAGRARWQAEHHLPTRSIDYQAVMRDPKMGHEVAAAYDAEPLRETEAIAHYKALAREVDQQFAYLTTTLGVKVDIVDHDPYATPEEMVTDVARGHLAVLSTRSTGSHPYLTDEQNDRFRAVHDAFGHAATGRGFDRNGEEAAYRSHATMFSPTARAALFTETQGQNAWLIEHGAFPPQKLAVLPERFWNDAALESKAVVRHVRTTAGVELYDQPLESVIVPDLIPHVPHRRPRLATDPNHTVGGRLSSSRPTDKAPAAAYVPGTNLVRMSPDLITDKAIPAIVARQAGVPGFGDLAGRTDRAVLDEIIDRQAANIVAAVARSMDLSPEATALHADWYPFAHDWLTTLADENGTPPDAVFAATAALSPTSAWPDNVAWAQFTTRMIAHQDETTVPLAWALAFHATRVGSWEKSKAKIESEGRTYDRPFPEYPGHIVGKKLSDLSDLDAAIAIRGAHDSFGGGPGAVRQLGGHSGFGNPKNLTRPQSDDNMAKAISILRNPSTANIDAQLGGNHKVRSFYANLRDPFDTTYAEVTVDSHHYGLSNGHPWTSTGSVFLKSKAQGITHAPKVGSTGVLGTYPLVVEATRRAAAIVNARYNTHWLPNQIQSIAWEQHKGEFPDSIRSNKAMQMSIEAAHLERARGNITPAQEWARVWEAMHGAGGPSDAELAAQYAVDLTGQPRDSLTVMRKAAAKAAKAAAKGVAA